MKLCDPAVGRASAQWLSAEEQTLLENAALTLDTKVLSNIRFWGKIQGAAADYLIVSAQNQLEEEQDYPEKTFFFCTNHSTSICVWLTRVAGERL